MRILILDMMDVDHLRSEMMIEAVEVILAGLNPDVRRCCRQKRGASLAGDGSDGGKAGSSGQ